MASVVLSVCTWRRPQGLRRLLTVLRGIVAPDGPDGFGVVVVENDAALEGAAVCREMASTYPWPLTCVVEPQRGFSHARNRAIGEALKDRPDFIAVLDDDEWPERTWLDELTRVQRQTGADIVGGPVVPLPSRAMEHWDVLAPYYGLTRDLADGAPCKLYGGGNFLARRQCFESLDGPFDLTFDQFGGEDLHFFQRLDRLGWQSRWAANAVVFEETPPHRLTQEWLLARQFRRGFVNVCVQRRLDPSGYAEASRLARSLAVLARAGAGRLRLGERSEPERLLAEMYWRYALGRLRAHGTGGASSGLMSQSGPSCPAADR